MVIWSFINFLACIGVIVVNGLANALPLNGMGTGELSDLYPNLFVPAGVTFSIWGIIYILLIGFCIYSIRASLSSKTDASFLKSVGPWFLLSCVANVLWIFAWHWQKVGLSLVVMLFLLFSLIIIYLNLNKRTEASLAELLFTRLPFSIYLGWITVALIANVTALLVKTGWGGFGLSETFWTVTVIIAAVFITLLVIHTRKDVGYSLVVIWALLGIVLKRSALGDAPAVTATAVGGIVVVALFLILVSVRKSVKRM